MKQFLRLLLSLDFSLLFFFCLLASETKAGGSLQAKTEAKGGSDI